MKPAAVGWQPDPTGRYEYRYWDGQQWAVDVFDDGLMFRDPFSLGKMPAPGRGTSRGTSRRWGPRLIGSGVLAAGLAASVAFAVAPVTGGGTETVDGGAPRGGQAPAPEQETSSTATNGSGPSTTAAPAAGDLAAPPGLPGLPGVPGSTGSSSSTTAAPSRGGGSEQELIDRIANGMAAAGGGTVPLDQAQCFAEALVDALGADRIVELGFEDGDVAAMGSGMAALTQQEQMSMAIAGMSCSPMPTA